MSQQRASRGGATIDAEGFTLVQTRAQRRRSASPPHNTTAQRERSPPKQTKPTEGQLRAATQYLQFIHKTFPGLRAHALQMLELLPCSNENNATARPTPELTELTGRAATSDQSKLTPQIQRPTKTNHSQSPTQTQMQQQQQTQQTKKLDFVSKAMGLFAFTCLKPQLKTDQPKSSTQPVRKLLATTKPA